MKMFAATKTLLLAVASFSVASVCALLVRNYAESEFLTGVVFAVAFRYTWDVLNHNRKS
jgi:hypothetical protein